MVAGQYIDSFVACPCRVLHINGTRSVTVVQISLVSRAEMILLGIQQCVRIYMYLCMCTYVCGT